MGEAASMGSFLLSSGAKGKRLALPSARIMIHQPLGGAQGQATDIELEAKEILRMKEMLIGIMAENSGQPYDKVKEDCERDQRRNRRTICKKGGQGEVDGANREERISIFFRFLSGTSKSAIT